MCEDQQYAVPFKFESSQPSIDDDDGLKKTLFAPLAKNAGDGCGVHIAANVLMSSVVKPIIETIVSHDRSAPKEVFNDHSVEYPPTITLSTGDEWSIRTTIDANVNELIPSSEDGLKDGLKMAPKWLPK